MEKSKHNLFAPIPGQNRYLIANPLAGTADLLTSAEAAEYEAGRFADPDAWATRGYLIDPVEEEARYRAAYLTFLEEQAQEEVQLFYAPTYACNFGCDYCYQEPYENAGSGGDVSVMDAFFSYVDKTFAGRRKYFTLFGGEPLLPTPRARDAVSGFLERAAVRGLETAVVTNGYHAASYVDVFKNAAVREVQVTLDGTASVHNRRRPLKGGGATFDQVADGVDRLLAANIPVNLRMVLDRENIGELHRLAAFAAAGGWTSHPLFKTQLGRNYELHHCNRAPGRLYSRLDLYRDIAAEIETHPEILAFHAPAFHFAKHLKDTGEMPPPNFDACPGTKSEWAFDYTGRIYSCTATVGKKDEALGTFYPEVRLDEDAVFAWQDRNVPAIPECSTCAARLLCGAGCGSLAKNRTGRLHGPDCRPAAELAAVGVGVYFKEDM